MGYKKFPYIDICEGKVKPGWNRQPLSPRRPLHIHQSFAPSKHSHRPVEMPVKSPCGVVPYGVIGLALPLAFVKLIGMWVPTTFLRDVLGY